MLSSMMAAGCSRWRALPGTFQGVRGKPYVIKRRANQSDTGCCSTPQRRFFRTSKRASSLPSVRPAQSSLWDIYRPLKSAVSSPNRQGKDCSLGGLRTTDEAQCQFGSRRAGFIGFADAGARGLCPPTGPVVSYTLGEFARPHKFPGRTRSRLWRSKLMRVVQTLKFERKFSLCGRKA